MWSNLGPSFILKTKGNFKNEFNTISDIITLKVSRSVIYICFSVIITDKMGYSNCHGMCRLYSTPQLISHVRNYSFASKTVTPLLLLDNIA